MFIIRLLISLSVVFLVLGLVFLILVLVQPEWLMARMRARSPEVLYSIDTNRKIVALTIDDGPDETHSIKIMELLEEYQAHATFFLITDRIPGNEAVLEQMIRKGHEIGNHLTEDEPSIQQSLESFEQDLLNSDRILSQYGEIAWMRPGSGWFNEKMLEIIKEHDYQIALGSIYPYDPQINLAWYSAKFVLWKAKPGAVIVLHDYQKRGERTVEALRMILPELTERGYQIVTLSTLVDSQNGSH